MKVLFEAIVDKFTGSALDTALGGRMYLYEAPEDAPMPLSVFMMESDISDYTFDDSHNLIGMLFFVNSEEGKAIEVWDYLELLEAPYDDC